MNRYIILFASILCSTLAAEAEPVSPAAARQAAERMLMSKGARLDGNAIQAPRRVQGTVLGGQSQTEISPYYIFNAAAGRGFVVVSGDDCLGDNLVLGYVDQGSFDAENVPPNMQSWLDATADVIELMSRSGVSTRAAALHADIAPLLTTHWGQGKIVYDPQFPYNALCPLDNGNLSVTGCMATALSQVMYYHRWPQDAFVGELPAYTTYTTSTFMEGLPSVKFDWDNMLDDYRQETTEEQQLAVATLMRYCGQLIQMDYTAQVSNGYSYDLDVLVTQFGYDQGVHMAQANEYSASGWEALLYGELNERRPLVHSGFSSSSGHAFVIDGYEVRDSIGYYHLNWGWDGQSDGFFRIDMLNPYDYGTGGGSSSDGFTMKQMTIIGFQPALSSLENYGRYVESYDWDIEHDDKPHYCSVLNNSYKPLTITVGLAERAADGTIDFSRIMGEQTLELDGYSFATYFPHSDDVLGFFTVPDSVANGLAPGSHRMVFVNKEVGTDAPWRPVFGPNCSVEIIVGEDGKQTETIFHPNVVLTANARSVKVVGLGGKDEMMMSGLQLTVEANISNKSDDDYTGNVGCMLYTSYDDVLTAVSYTSSAINIDANGKTQLNLHVRTPDAGNYIAVLTKGFANFTGKKLAEIKKESNYIGQKLFTTKELTFSLSDVKYDVSPNLKDVPTAHIDFVVNNNTAIDYNTILIVRVYKNNGEGTYMPYVFSSGYDYHMIMVEVASGKSGSYRLYLDNILEPGEYYVMFQMASDYVGRMFDDYIDFYSFGLQLHEETDISVVDRGQSNDSGVWFSLDGRKIERRPTEKGIYVHGGRKFVVK